MKDNSKLIVIGRQDLFNECLNCGESMPFEAVSLYCARCIAVAGGTYKLNAKAL